ETSSWCRATIPCPCSPRTARSSRPSGLPLRRRARLPSRERFPGRDAQRSAPCSGPPSTAPPIAEARLLSICLENSHDFFRGIWRLGDVRYAEPAVVQTLAARKMAFVAGPRQVGKTTLAQSVLGTGAGYFNWDVTSHRRAILRAPEGFWEPTGKV